MRRIALTISLLLAAAGCDDSTRPDYDLPPQDDSVQGYVSIAYLKTLCRTRTRPIHESVSVRGRVTANDLFGEFDRTIFLEDDTGGIEIWIDDPLLARSYPVGSGLDVHCYGLALGDYGGKIVLGASPSTEAYPADRIAPDEATRHLRRNDLPADPIIPRTIRMGDASAALTGRYIRLDEVFFAAGETGLGWCDPDPEGSGYLTTERHLYDPEGEMILVRTIGRCEYAAEPIPAGTGSVSAILDYFNGAYQLRIVNRGIDFRQE